MSHDVCLAAHSKHQCSVHCLMPGMTRLILGLLPVNERQRYFVIMSHWLGASLEAALPGWIPCNKELQPLFPNQSVITHSADIYKLSWPNYGIIQSYCWILNWVSSISVYSHGELCMVPLKCFYNELWKIWHHWHEFMTFTIAKIALWNGSVNIWVALNESKSFHRSPVAPARFSKCEQL